MIMGDPSIPVTRATGTPGASDAKEIAKRIRTGKK